MSMGFWGYSCGRAAHQDMLYISHHGVKLACLTAILTVGDHVKDGVTMSCSLPLFWVGCLVTFIQELPTV